MKDQWANLFQGLGTSRTGRVFIQEPGWFWINVYEPRNEQDHQGSIKFVQVPADKAAEYTKKEQEYQANRQQNQYSQGYTQPPVDKVQQVVPDPVPQYSHSVAHFPVDDDIPF